MKANRSRAKWIALVAVLCMLFCTTGTMAEGHGFDVVDPPSLEEATGMVTVSGLLNAVGMDVVLMVFLPGTELNGILNTPNELAEKLYYTDTVQSAGDREFRFHFDMTNGPDGVEGASGDYPFILACGEIETGTIRYTNRNTVLNALHAVAACENAEQLQSILTAELAEELGINVTLASEAQKLTGELVQSVYGAVVEKEFDADNLESAVIVRSLFEEPAAFALLQSTKDPEKLQEYSMQYNEYYGFAMDEDSNYAKIIKAENREIVYQVLANEGDMTSKEAAQDSFNKAVLIGYINDITASGTLLEVLQENAAVLGLDFTAFTALSTDTQRAGVVNGLMKLTLTSTEAVSSQFRALVEQYASSGGGGSITTAPPSSGGGGGGGSSWTGLPVVTGTEVENGLSETENRLPFQDLAGVQWAQESIIALYNRGIVNGKSEGVFDPESNVTRAEFVKMVVSMLNLTSDTGDQIFNDVAQTDWYYDVVRVSTACGIVKGYGNMFEPEAAITREDAAVILARAAQYAGISLAQNSAAVFTDADTISDYAVEAVGAMQANGVIMGMEDGSFQPQQYTTRAQACKMLYKLLK